MDYPGGPNANVKVLTHERGSQSVREGDMTIEAEVGVMPLLVLKIEDKATRNRGSF